MRRIGRPPTPAERGLRYAYEDEHLLHLLARNLILHEEHITPAEVGEYWDNLPPEHRDAWCERVLAALRDHVVTEVVPDPEPQGPTPGSAVSATLASDPARMEVA